jgi:hypothetical protein
MTASCSSSIEKQIKEIGKTLTPIEEPCGKGSKPQIDLMIVGNKRKNLIRLITG